MALGAFPLAMAVTGHHSVRRMAMACGWLLLIGAWLTWSWRLVPSGPANAWAGVLTTAAGLCAVGGLRAVFSRMTPALSAALASLTAALALTIGPFLLGPALDDLPAGVARWLLFANPWVMSASAAGIDVLHLDWVYHLSPLAHRGVALPHWSAACAAYAVFGLVCYGATRLFPQESTNR